MTHFSEFYVTTITDLNNEIIQTLKLKAKAINAQAKVDEIAKYGMAKPKVITRYYLRIRPRLGLNSPFAHLYAKGTGYLHREASQCIKPEHGQRYDLYLAPSYTYNY